MPDPLANQSPEQSLEKSSAAPATQEGAPASESPATESPAEDGAAQTAHAATAEGTANQATTRASGFAAVLEWFWLGQAMRVVHERGSTLNVRGRELLRRARLASELAGRALEPPEPLPSGQADALACELYRESVYWCLAASQQRDAVASTVQSSDSTWDFEALWTAADPSLLASSPDATALKSQLANRGFREFAELDPTEQHRLAQSLRRFTDHLIAALDASQSVLDRLWLKRIVRLALAAIAVVGIGYFVLNAASSREAGHDLTQDAMWSASSVYGPEPGCTPPAQECASSPNFFIATEEEENPWVLFDLKKPQKVSAIRVDNRIDCCYERAIPLIVEVSDDQKSWKEVARRTTDFSTWKGTFPTVETRYVRLRIAKRTNLNLSRVRLLP